ncbi:MAG: hypothetical protein JNM56_30875 [Planctomycetia bacterium]|nr:hypothetical protein [Planctomycetia bacterium]
MRTRSLSVGALLALFVASIGLFAVAQDDKPKFTTKEVMKKAHDGNPKLCAKVATGKASKEEKEQLVELYVALSKNKPAKGDAKSWEEKCNALVAAAKECLTDDKAGGAKLQKAVNCKACHEVHK